MQRLSLSVLLAIALLSGIVAGMTIRPPAASVTPAIASGGTETVVAFYDALNRALSGGSTEDLAALLAPAFRDHDTASGISRSADEFVESVRALGRTSGAVRLDVTAIEASGNNLMVSVQPVAPGPRAVAGVSVEQDSATPGLEVLRVARGKVVDRWPLGTWGLDATALEEIPFHVPGQPGLAASLIRVEIPTGSVHEWTAALTGFVLIESGAAAVDATHQNGRLEASRLDSGDGIEVDAGDRVRLQPETSEPVSVLIYAPIPAAASVPPPSTAIDPWESQGVTRTLLWRGPHQPPGNETMHRLGIIELPAGNEIRLTAPAGVTLLLSIDAGTLDIAVPGGSIELLGDDFALANHEGYVRMAADQAASIATDSELVLRNTADYAVRVLLIATGPV